MSKKSVPQKKINSEIKSKSTSNKKTSESEKLSDNSYTRAAEYTTAAKVGKEYKHEFRTSENIDKSADRLSDGSLSSEQYTRLAPEGAEIDETHKALQIEFNHPAEKWIHKKNVRRLLGFLSKENKKGKTRLERMLLSYRNSSAPIGDKIKFWAIHKIMNKLFSAESWAKFATRDKQFQATLRGMNIVAKSLAEFGPTIPQKFTSPLFVVWNFTNSCNLKCKHCYQDSEHETLCDELTLAEKLDVVDQMGALHIPMLAISGGEPTLSKDLVPVIKRASEYGMHISLATNGTTMTQKRANELLDAGLRYVEISLDSVSPERHDAFRGVPGMWEKSVAGARVVAKTKGLRLGIATCIHQGNYDELEKIIEFAEHDLKANCFAHFNFIPVGRGLKMVQGDITPAQREKLLSVLNRKMQAGGIGIISTAPQLGRVCLAGAALDSGKITCSHAGSGSGIKARVVAKYLGGCGAGRCYVALEPNGNMTPCVYLPHRVMGNLRTQKFNDIFRGSIFWDILNDRTKRLGHCEVCKFSDYCGGCRARADAYFGELHAGDPGCVFNDKHWEKLIDDGIAVINENQSAEKLELSPMRHGPG